ncbi:hypothetical protein GCM10010987_63010 [Bradyrhizobium guangdongense]|uniref:Uncharacterized protein n=1 Tax=Bradyrhizobium guangdongense TaxID=1325090 RepID=A0AA88BBC3_9BRAD|nr:hypothetical protein GCM10010987_63010 [Bradyrhizobium guangdongense]
MIEYCQASARSKMSGINPVDHATRAIEVLAYHATAPEGASNFWSSLDSPSGD